MGIQHVKKHIICLLHIIGVATVDHAFKVLICQAFINEEILHASSQRIIHDCIILIPTKPVDCVMPYFSQYIDIRFYGFESTSEFFTEGMGHFIGYINTDTIYIVFTHPAAHDIHQVPSDLWVIGIELWHSIEKGKGIQLPFLRCLPFIIQRPQVNHEPVIIL